jgi:hypothetical protein
MTPRPRADDQHAHAFGGWLEQRETPWGGRPTCSSGALSHSGRFRAVVCVHMTLRHLPGALQEIVESCRQRTSF